MGILIDGKEYTTTIDRVPLLCCNNCTNECVYRVKECLTRPFKCLYNKDQPVNLPNFKWSPIGPQ